MTTGTTVNEHMLDRLACALALPKTAEQRATLRTLAYEVLRTLTTDAEVARVFASSPLVGPTKTQVNPRPCIAGLRDMLKLETLTCLVHGWATDASDGRAELERIFQAIQHPTSHGARGAGRTGFAFGKAPGHDAAFTALKKALADHHAAMPAPRRAAASPGSGRGWARGAAPATRPRGRRSTSPP
jgi:hypothetical protein